MKFKDDDILSIQTQLPMKILYSDDEMLVEYSNLLSTVMKKDSKTATVVLEGGTISDLLDTLTSISNIFGYKVIGPEPIESSQELVKIKIRIKDSLLQEIAVDDFIVLEKVYIACITNKENGTIFLACDKIKIVSNIIKSDIRHSSLENDDVQDFLDPVEKLKNDIQNIYKQWEDDIKTIDKQYENMLNTEE
eukprot:TRINITY_DN6965_c0_g1_i1.p1 TRINITY_DN6965_c0_g1~~TRINITY_DN6965_c0_g1_i1.p1  ORF type:complete len:192 (-),score=29.52 TRINITY_DN6965_c0_g1_i1:730-1305(-)